MTLEELIEQQRELQKYSDEGTGEARALARLDECGEIAHVTKFGIVRDGVESPGWCWWREGKPGLFERLVEEISDLMRFLLIEVIVDLDSGKRTYGTEEHDRYEELWGRSPTESEGFDVGVKLAMIAQNVSSPYNAIYHLVWLCHYYNVTRVDLDKAMKNTYVKVIARANERDGVRESTGDRS